jgi:ABC-type methionine transport system ATPase subunit
LAMIEVRGLWKCYGKSGILKGIDLDVDKRRILGVIGSTGSGKTTLLRLIDLLESPTQGKIIFDGVEISSKSEREQLKARRRIAMVFQKPTMFNASVYNNIQYGLKVRGLKDNERIMSALEAVGLKGYERRLATTLSGGEMQRLAFARAMVIKPDVMLLDEPTANLDPRSAAIIEALIEHLVDQGVTIIMATHNMAQCRKLADSVLVLKEGRVCGWGTPQEIFAGSGPFGVDALEPNFMSTEAAISQSLDCRE